MSQTYEIPLTPQAQFFNIALAGVTYKLALKWNTVQSLWLLDISDVSGNLLIGCIPVVANTNLLAPYGYMNFGGQLIAQTDNNVSADPTYDNLGSTSHLYFVTTP